MAERFAGITYVLVDGNQLPLQGNFTVSPSRFERAMVAGLDYVHGFSELPRVPFIEGDISTLPEVSTDTLEAITDATVQANMPNGKTYVLRNAICRSALEIASREGRMRVRFEGLDCIEVG